MASEADVDWERVKMNWKVHSVSARERWPTVTERDLVAIAGDRDRIIIFLQDKCGFGKAHAEFEVEMWRRGLQDSATLVAANHSVQAGHEQS